jgi:hypothetical protein
MGSLVRPDSTFADLQNPSDGRARSVRTRTLDGGVSCANSRPSRPRPGHGEDRHHCRSGSLSLDTHGRVGSSSPASLFGMPAWTSGLSCAASASDTTTTNCLQGRPMSITGLGDLAQWLQTAQSIVAIIGLPVLILTLVMIWRQARYAHHAAMSQVYQNTADGFAIVQNVLVDHPEYRPYFYDDKRINTSDPEYAQVSSIAEFWLHAVHNLTVHRRYMKEYPWYVWERSLRDVYSRSPILQHFLQEHPDWYTDEVHRILTGRTPSEGDRAFTSGGELR